MRTSVIAAIGSMSIVALVAAIAGVMHFRGAAGAPRAEIGTSKEKTRAQAASGATPPGNRSRFAGYVAPPGEADETAPAAIASAQAAPVTAPAQKSSEEEFRGLFAEIERETLDARWATSKESTIRDAAKSVPGLTVGAIRCGSIRCSAELTATSTNLADAVHRMQRIPGLARAQIRSMPGPNGFSLQAVMARDGFNITGTPESDDP